MACAFKVLCNTIKTTSNTPAIFSNRTLLFQKLNQTRVLSATTANMSSGSGTKYFMLMYQYVPNVVERRAPFRTDHLQHAQRYSSEGKLILGGAFADPVDSAAVVFKVGSKDEVEEFARQDPYVRNGIVTDWKVREWTVVIGSAYEK